MWDRIRYGKFVVELFAQKKERSRSQARPTPTQKTEKNVAFGIVWRLEKEERRMRVVFGSLWPSNYNRRRLTAPRKTKVVCRWDFKLRSRRVGFLDRAKSEGEGKKCARLPAAMASAEKRPKRKGTLHLTGVVIFFKKNTKRTTVWTWLSMIVQKMLLTMWIFSIIKIRLRDGLSKDREKIWKKNAIFIISIFILKKKFIFLHFTYLDAGKVLCSHRRVKKKCRALKTSFCTEDVGGWEEVVWDVTQICSGQTEMDRRGKESAPPEERSRRQHLIFPPPRTRGKTRTETEGSCRSHWHVRSRQPPVKVGTRKVPVYNTKASTFCAQ